MVLISEHNCALNKLNSCKKDILMIKPLFLYTYVCFNRRMNASSDWLFVIRLIYVQTLLYGSSIWSIIGGKQCLIPVPFENKVNCYIINIVNWSFWVQCQSIVHCCCFADLSSMYTTEHACLYYGSWNILISSFKRVNSKVHNLFDRSGWSKSCNIYMWKTS